MPLTILADDLTGACDSGTLFAGQAPVPVTVWPGLPRDSAGLPFLRVSVDHGTAVDRAWKGIANHESMDDAIEVAVRMLEKQ